MGTSTVSGPFRSQNGFQQLVNGVWTPVGSGGGGGGVTFVYLANDVNEAVPDNRYSTDPSVLSGDTAGTIVTLPYVEVGQTISVLGIGGNSNDVWCIKLTPTPGADITYFLPSLVVTPNFPYGVGEVGVALLSGPGGPADQIFIYGASVGPILIARLPLFDVPGYGIISTYQFTTPLTTFAAFNTNNNAPYDVNTFPRA